MNCPHCNRIIRTSSPSRHVKVCPENPAIQVELLAVLEDPENPGRLQSQSRYDAIAKQRGLPASSVLSKHYSNWIFVAERFGLLPSIDSNERVWQRNVVGTRAELLRLSILLHDGLQSPNRNEYEVQRNVSCSLEPVALIRRFGSWEATCAALDVPPPASKRKQYDREDYEESEVTCSPPYWFDWQKADGRVVVSQVNYPVFHG